MKRLRWLLPRIGLALLAPLLLLGLTELALRTFNIGHDTDFLLPAEVDGVPVWVENPFYTYQIFTPPMARIPATIVATQNKPPDLLRVVVLGESAAQGDPIPDFGPARALEYTLRHHAPHARVEVINAAITAINSHQIRDIARELHKLQPDIVILYIGNNEVIGPYGPGTVFARFIPNDVTLRTIAWLQRHLRLTQVMRFAAFLLSPDRDGQTFTGVQMFMDHPVRHDDPRLPTVHRRFHNNLQFIIQQAQQAGAHVLLNTVAVNTTDCPPSLSTHRPDLSHLQRAAWNAHLERGIQHAGQHNWTNARTAFAQALAIDDEHAELHYWLALSHQAQSQPDAAYHFQRALDLDAFRYRTDTALNDLIRQIAADHPTALTLVDAAARFTAVDDAEHFVDHVHFSFTGTARLAAIWADTILRLDRPFPIQDRAGPPTPESLRETLLFTDVAESSLLHQMRSRFSRPPFSRQLNSADRIATYTHRLEVLADRMRNGEHLHTLSQQFADRIQTYPDDLHFRMHYAVHLIGQQRYREARPVLQEAMTRHPHRRGPRSLLAQIEATLGHAGHAADLLLGHGQKHSYFAVIGTQFLTGQLVPSGYLEEAAAVSAAILERIGPFDFAWQVQQEAEQTRQWADQFAASARHLDAGDLDTAEAVLTNLLHSHQGHLGEAIYRLAVIDRMRGERARGFAKAREALQTMSFARAQYHAGLWHLSGGQIDTARDHFAAAAERAHDDQPLRQSLAALFIQHPATRAPHAPTPETLWPHSTPTYRPLNYWPAAP
jgi:tetratricopeptide (TPR) repeat protein